jgi:1-aminocyclopropane-1-carboxylate synthase
MNNELMSNEICEKFSQLTSSPLHPSFLRYNDFSGCEQLRREISCFINENICFRDILVSDDLILSNGCGTSIESLCHVLCDENDSVLVPSPYYGGLDFDMVRRAKVNIFPFKYTRNSLEKTFSNVSPSNRIRALFIINPSNPTGFIYSRDDLLDMIKFCKKRKLHLVVDEIYALSVFGKYSLSAETKNHNKFVSILTLLDLVDGCEEFVHVLWGLSKDFCMNGFRVGITISKNKSIIGGLKELCYFTSVSMLVQHHLLTLFKHEREWILSFIQSNQTKLANSYDFTVTKIQQFNRSLLTNFEKENFPTRKRNLDEEILGTPITYIPVTSTFFLWINLRFFLNDLSQDSELNLFSHLMNNGVYIVPGIAFHSEEIGWFRLMFAVPLDYLELALERLFNTLKQVIRKEIKCS